MARRRRDKDVAVEKPEPDEWDEDGARPGEDDEGGDEEPRPPRRRRTLAEAAAESAPAGGLRCPKCGCGHLEVARTWDVRDGRRRKRVCRNCGHEFPTTERQSQGHG